MTTPTFARCGSRACPHPHHLPERRDFATTREPRVQRFMGHPAPDPTLPPDSAWQDVVAVAFAVVILLLICFLSSVIPTRELLSVMTGPR